MAFNLVCALLMVLLTFGGANASGEGDLLIKSTKPGAKVEVDRVMEAGKVLISVYDEKDKPVLGLTPADFSVTESGRTAKIVSVQPISESLDVPRHIVLVLDNSASMDQRGAIRALLAGVDELLKIVRPIDDVQMVVFSKDRVEMGGRKLNVRTFKSSNPAELKDFAFTAYSREGVTSTTVLYEAMLAGLDIISRMPATEPRFMVIFSDGEDLNSDYKKEDVMTTIHKDFGRFNAYAIDYMPGEATDKFLTKFAKQNKGQIWKAKSETNLVTIFQSVASQIQYYYVLTYQYPPTGKLAVSPDHVAIDEIAAATVERKIEPAALTVRPTVDAAYGVANWKVLVSNSKGRVAEAAGEGAPPAEVNIPLPTADLAALAAGGDFAVKFDLQDKQGQSLSLPPTPVRLAFNQTKAQVNVEPATITIEEIKTIDASPMLGQIYFDKGSSEIAPRYIRFASAAETAGFDEQKFRDTLEKYYQVLNIVGKRLAEKPEATVTLVGCNDFTGVEKGKKELSAQRAEAVKNYLQTVWNIAPERMNVEARNLPQMPSTSSTPEGQTENRRVEIHASDPVILAPIRSTYLAIRIDKSSLLVKPEVVSPHGVASWKITASNAAGIVAELGGGDQMNASTLNLPDKDLRALGTGGDITVKMEIKDKKGQQILPSPVPVKVNFIETRQRLAQKQDQLVQEKYALILFDFDKDTIGPSNQAIVSRIVERIKALPNATVSIVGHTDNIGKEKYNIKLSERRAVAVDKLIKETFGEPTGDRIKHSGVGPSNPLFDNISPEGRSFNRTVTITLEYMSAE